MERNNQQSKEVNHVHGMLRGNVLWRKMKQVEENSECQDEICTVIR